MKAMKKHLKVLGMLGRDKVTGVVGVVTSISFDLFGCIQVVLQPQVGENGKCEDGRWFDIGRVGITNAEPVMPTPDFDQGSVAEGKKGPAEKPMMP